MLVAVLHMMDHRLLDVGRGVWLVHLPKNKKQHEGSVCYVERAVGPRAGPARTYNVNSKGTVLTGIRPHQMRMVSLNDPRHWKEALEFDDDPDQTFPPHMDAEWCNRQRQYIPVTPGYKWEYLDAVDNTWKEYNEHVQYNMETLYDMGGEHFLYTLGAPHAEGKSLIGSIDPQDRYVGNVWYLNQHDSCTRQIVFKEQTDHHRPLMTERDLYTGMRRPVRRLGPLPPPDHDSMHLRDYYGPAFHFKNNAQNNGSFCGLCYSTKGPFTKTECCGNWVCDSQGSYEMGSFERDGQCERNHRLGSVCGFHHDEHHSCDNWKECQECENFFHPYDYAVKASSQAKSGTNRRYNFDNHVRHDLDVCKIEFPTCFTCKEPVDTTEETTQTLMLRKTMASGKTFCKYHGGGFGKISGIDIRNTR